MYLKDANEILRRAIIREYFVHELSKAGYIQTDLDHPILGSKGLSKDNVIHLYFDVTTGSDYPDGDDWFIVEYLLPMEANLPDQLKTPEFFTTLPLEKGGHNWRHRELIRYKYAKTKKLEEALQFIQKVAAELSEAVKQVLKKETESVAEK